jgi:hypothetical protein
MSLVKEGTHEITVEVVDIVGNSLVTLMSRPMPVYRRADGSPYIMSDGRRSTIIRREDGSFYLRVVKAR